MTPALTQEQVFSWVKTTLGIISGYAVAKGWGDANLWIMITGLVTAVVPLVWGYIANTKLAQVQQAASLDEVEKVVIKSSVGDGIARAADDPNQPKITK